MYDRTQFVISSIDYMLRSVVICKCIKFRIVLCVYVYAYVLTKYMVYALLYGPSFDLRTHSFAKTKWIFNRRKCLFFKREKPSSQNEWQKYASNLNMQINFYHLHCNKQLWKLFSEGEHFQFHLIFACFSLCYFYLCVASC